MKEQFFVLLALAGACGGARQRTQDTPIGSPLVTPGSGAGERALIPRVLLFGNPDRTSARRASWRSATSTRTAWSWG